MAVYVDDKKLEENEGTGGYDPETKYIEEGAHPARLVSYIELGKHTPVFKKKPQVYESGKNKGKPKPPELLIHLIFEFPDCDYDIEPLCIKTSIPFGEDGEFINKLPVTDALAQNKISKTYADRSKFMKYKNAMNAALGTDYKSLHEFVGEGFLISVTNRVGKKAREDGSLPVYANMKPDGIQKTAFKNPVTKKVEEVPVPEAKGEYCPMFDWDEPTKESWDLLPDYLKDTIKKAVNYEGSPTQLMLVDYPEGNEEEGTEDNPAPEQSNKPAETDDLPVD